MPRNSRPGKFLDPFRKNQSIAEIEDAQNQWDLLEAQEEANELARQRLEQERENAEMIAEATREAEEKRQKHEEKMEKERQEHEIDVELMRQEHNIENRYNKLCDDIGISYKDLCDFELIINYLENEQKDFNEYRRHHYSREMEILFRKLDFNIRPIKKEDIKSIGNSEDYIDYIYNKLMDKASTIEDIKEFEPDRILIDVIEYVVKTQKVSAVDIQNRFNITMKRAKDIIEQMEIRGVITGIQNENSREVLWTWETFQKLTNSTN